MGRPFIWQLVDSHLSLLGQHVLFDLPPIFPKVGPSTQHEFVAHNSQRKVIGCKWVVLSAHHLWSHVSRCSARIVRVILPVLTRDAEISNSQVSISIKDQILRLHIPMNDVVLMDVLESNDHVGHEKLTLAFIENPFVSQVISQIPSIEVVHDQE